MEKENRKKELEASLKSLDTEEFIDIHFYRPIAISLGFIFSNSWAFLPTQLQSQASFLGVAAGYLVLFYRYKNDPLRYLSFNMGKLI